MAGTLLVKLSHHLDDTIAHHLTYITKLATSFCIAFPLFINAVFVTTSLCYLKYCHHTEFHLRQISPSIFLGMLIREVRETAVAPANLAPPRNMALLINILNCSALKRSYSLPFTIEDFCITYSHIKSVMSLQSHTTCFLLLKYLCNLGLSGLSRCDTF